jgi:subtilisin family serine protease
MKTSICPLALCTVMASSGLAAAEEMSATAKAQITAIQSEKAARTPAQAKLDSRLLYLTREAKGLPAVAGAPEMKSRVALDQHGRVDVDISAVPSADLNAAIVAAGGVVIYESPRWSSVRASVPPAALPLLAARADVKQIAKGSKATTHAVTNQADPAHKANIARATYGLNGAGLKIGVLSDSDDKSEASVASGELPVGIWSVLPGGHTGRPGTGEGTAMCEIVHDIAPGAQIIFAAAGPGKPGFADAILGLKAAGCSILVDDISYGDEWQFQDDAIGQAINTVVAAGALYLSSSGNEGNLKNNNSTTWEGDFLDGGANALIPGGKVHSFGSKNYNTLTTATSGATLQWSDEAHSSANEYDLFVLNAAGTAIVTSSTNSQTGTQVPFEEAENVKVGERIVIWKATAAAARYLRLSCTGSPLEFQTAGQTIGHAATANCICVAASDASINTSGFTTASILEDSSSDGPHRMFYNPNGTPITPGNFLAATNGGLSIQSPALTAGDGGATSVPGFLSFYGTSAAAPAAAAIAALVWQRNPALTNTQLRTLLENSCLDIEGPGREINSGYGILMADLAIGNASTYQSWRTANFTAGELGNSAISGDLADPDHDGICNLLEYSFNLLPKTANRNGVPTGVIQDVSGTKYLSLTFRRQIGNPKLTYTPQTSSIVSSTWLNNAVLVGTPTANGNGTETVTYRDSTAMNAASKRFMRVAVTIAP